MGMVSLRNCDAHNHGDYSAVRSDILIWECYSRPSCVEIHLVSVGETLAVKQEKGNRHDRFAVAVIRQQSREAADTMIVCHISREFSQYFWTFLEDGGKITCDGTGKRKKGKGLEVPYVLQLYREQRGDSKTSDFTRFVTVHACSVCICFCLSNPVLLSNNGNWSGLCQFQIVHLVLNA